MRFMRISALALAMTLLLTQPAYAKLGDLGFFGGISQGTRLPKTTETLLGTTTTTRGGTSLPYKEVVFLTGKPQVFEGLLTVTTSGAPSADKPVGTYNETYRVGPSAATSTDVVINRSITFRVNYRIEGTQTIKDYTPTRWTETIAADGANVRIDTNLSQFSIGIIEDATPGCTYYKGTISQRSVYTAAGTGAAATGENTTVDVLGSFYGYNNAWSSTEAQRLDGTVSTKDWQMQYQVRPSVSMTKTLRYSENEPTLISFAGNYQEVMQNLSGLSYNLYMKPLQFYEVPDTGNVSLDSYNMFEQLIAPDVTYLKGHAAEQDIKKLFSMQVLEGDPKFYQPSQAITRDQFVTALTKAIKLPIEPVATNNKRNTTVMRIVFPDVTQDRASYPYIMAAYKAKLAVGRSDGMFYSDSPIERQEAIVLILRALGLSQLGLDPTPVTVFYDDASIAGWAKKEIYAANRIGIVFPDDSGRVSPKSYVSKAEAAAFINRLIDYMRADIADDYSAHIVNFPD